MLAPFLVVWGEAAHQRPNHHQLISQPLLLDNEHECAEDDVIDYLENTSEQEYRKTC
jgi:hypothetical protein